METCNRRVRGRGMNSYLENSKTLDSDPFCILFTHVYILSRVLALAWRLRVLTIPGAMSAGTSCALAGFTRPNRSPGEGSDTSRNPGRQGMDGVSAS